MKAVVTCTYPNDYGWLRHTAKSIERFLTGFDHWFIWAPLPFHASMSRILDKYRGKIPMTVKWFSEWPGKGFCHHEWIIVNSDELHGPGFDTFTNWDSDTLLCRPMDASEFFGIGGRIYLPSGDKQRAMAHNPLNQLWYPAVQRAIGILPDTHGMCWMPITYHRETLRKTRELILKHTRKTAEDYIRSCKNDFPQTFAEFNTLSCVAERFQPDLYLPQQAAPFDTGSIVQFWSHGGIDRPLDNAPWHVAGKTFNTPRELISHFGFL